MAIGNVELRNFKIRTLLILLMLRMLDLKCMSFISSVGTNHYLNWVSSLSNILATILLKMFGLSPNIRKVIANALGLTTQVNRIVNI